VAHVTVSPPIPLGARKIRAKLSVYSPSSVRGDLIPGGVSKQIRASAAARILEQVKPSGPAQQARYELAGKFLADLRRIDAQLRETKAPPLTRRDRAISPTMAAMIWRAEMRKTPYASALARFRRCRR
jgi:hypothetical protein